MTEPLPQAAQVMATHDALLARPGWPASSDISASANASTEALPALWQWLHTNHRCNALFWAEEDLARRTQVGAEQIAANKRAIDGFNQARNDATERIDELLLLALGLVDETSAGGDAPRATAAAGARLNSETAGAMIDRLSIMALKIHAMRAQGARTDVDDAHRAASQAKLARLLEQRADLGRCLDELLADAQAGRAYFKVYRQFKMYNDARFNPALVAEARLGGQADGKR